MIFVRNIRGQTGQLEEIHKSCIKSATRVLAAVAYVTDSRPFLEICWNEKKPVTLYARHDYTGPVNPSVFEWFFSKSSQDANFEIRLIRDIFHPKIIWWKEVGAYIGSANLTHAAWFQNFEAGLFLTEEEIIEAGFLDQLEDFFDEIHSVSHSVTREVANQIVEFNKKTGAAEYNFQKEFSRVCPIPAVPSLISITRLAPQERKKTKFLTEWNQSLEYLRNIAFRLKQPGNCPPWIPQDTPSGVLADQFLHAFYYNQVKQGNQTYVEEFYRQNSKDKNAALTEAIEWWKQLPAAPSNELDHITVWAPEIRKRLANGAVANMSENDFTEVCKRVHAMLDHARRMDSTDFGFSYQMKKMNSEQRIALFSNWLYAKKSKNGLTACGIFDFVLFGGHIDQTPERLYIACYEPEYKIPHLGVSMLGELIGWALPDNFPPRNGRTSKGLRSLGFDVMLYG